MGRERRRRDACADRPRDRRGERDDRGRRQPQRAGGRGADRCGRRCSPRGRATAAGRFGSSGRRRPSGAAAPTRSPTTTSRAGRSPRSPTTAWSRTGGSDGAGGRDARRQPRLRRPSAERRRQDVRLQAAPRHPLLERSARSAGGLPPLARAPAAPQRKDPSSAYYDGILGARRCRPSPGAATSRRGSRPTPRPARSRST